MKVTVKQMNGLQIQSQAVEGGIFQSQPEPSIRDTREHVPMFEHKLVVEQLKNTIQEKNKIMGQYLKLQTDINSVSNMMKERLFKRLNINKSEANFAEASDPDYQSTIDQLSRANLYTNRSEVQQIDSLAHEIFSIFVNLKKFIQKREEDSLDLSLEEMDKVGYLFTPEKLEFGTSVIQGEAVADKIKKKKEECKAKFYQEKILRKSRVTNTSTNMTSTISNSKMISLNEPLVKDESKRNFVKTKVRSKWIPNEHAEDCFHCEKKFSLLRWRHHCRECGNVFCGSCCYQYNFASGFEDQKVKLCEICAEYKNARDKSKATVKDFSVFSGKLM
ncbi:unnamed protein product [Moneuplotes crassus]|uniref:FYVE-type domain-containing protein n=2 Tax=Euplotes crassus TaxID=5936 RepID=A0AAD1UAR2_EUPCR|nr:unnamed protein product [Moneuplotes crassus]